MLVIRRSWFWNPVKRRCDFAAWSALLAVIFAFAAVDAYSSAAFAAGSTKFEKLLDRLDALGAEETRVLGKLRSNLAFKKTIDSEFDTLDERERLLEGEIQALNAFCQGEHNEPEYSRRKAICNEKGPPLDQRKAGLATERAQLDERKRTQEEEAASLIAAYGALKDEAAQVLGSIKKYRSLADLVGQCEAMSTIALKSACFRNGYDALPESFRIFEPAGNGLIGGTGWQIGYYVAEDASPELRAKTQDILREQAAAAGIDLNAIDLETYNFVIGLAASTEFWTDMRRRVIFDQLSRGEYTAEYQVAYNALRGRQFEELGCHSNGAMICLAALRNHDVTADRIVLYGPQLTTGSLLDWNEMLAKNGGALQSVEIRVNEGDPVAPGSLVISNLWPSDRISRYGKIAFAAAVAAPLLFEVDLVDDAVNALAPDVNVKTGTCPTGRIPLPSCHEMALYRKNRQ